MSNRTSAAALKPSLKPVEVKALIQQGRERQLGADGRPGRVNLIDPRMSVELAGLKALTSPSLPDCSIRQAA